jgi:membrane fusion protein, multidrug efflux system
MAEQEKQPAPLRRKRSLARRAIAIAAIAAIAYGGFLLWRYVNSYESTDDAQIDGHIDSISARVTGHVIDVRAEDEQFVHAGDILVMLDPKDYEVAVEKAEADLADAEAALETARTNVPIVSVDTASQVKTARSTRADAEAARLGAERQLTAARARLTSAEAQVREAEAYLKKANDDVARYKLLIAKNEIPQQQYDTAVSVANANQATVDARKAAGNEAEQNIVVAQTSIDQANQRISQADASIDAANTAPQQVKASRSRAQEAAAQVAQRRALLDQAKLNLSYCTIKSPVTGIVGKKTVELGQNVTPGEQMMAVVPLDDIWVTANFKETQLGRMKPDQRVRVKVDAFDRTYTGKIMAVGGASGSRFSVIPPENATGNYVKVVQRIPVRINLDPGQNNDHLLRPGMSVDPKVYLE